MTRRKRFSLKGDPGEIAVGGSDVDFARSYRGPNCSKVDQHTRSAVNAGFAKKAFNDQELAAAVKTAILTEYEANGGKKVPASPSLQIRINWRLGWNEAMGKPLIQLKAIHKYIDDLFAEEKLPASYETLKKARTI